MKKTNNLLIVLFSISANMGFAIDHNRYETLVTAFNAQKGTFDTNVISYGDQDIQVIKDHKQAATEKLAEYKGSWAPTVLRVLGLGFGLESAVTALLGIGRFDPTNTFDSVIKSSKPILRYIGYAKYPIHYGTMTLSQPISNKLRDMYFKKGSITGTTYDLGIGALYATRSLATAAIATYLFNKADSYKTEIEKLEKEIEIDDTMIKDLVQQKR